MKKILCATVLASLVFGAASMAQARGRSGQGTIVIKDPGEFNAYRSAINQPTPQAKEAAIEGFLEKYPDSAVKKPILEILLDAYTQGQNADKAVETARKLLEIDPTDMRALALIAWTLRSQAAQKTNPADAQLLLDEAAADAEQGLAAGAPADADAASFDNVKTAVIPIFDGAIAADDLQKKDYVDAIKYFQDELNAMSPQQQTAGPGIRETYLLGNAYVQENPQDLANAVWYLARAAAYAPEPFKDRLQKAAQYWYKKYHGGDDGFDRLQVQAKASLAAPGPARAQQALSRINVSDAVASANLLSKTNPVYPAIAVAARVQGTVVLDIVVATNGTVESIKPVSGPALLIPSATDAVKTWQYKPYLLDGKPVDVESRVNVDFVLSAPPKASVPLPSNDSAPNMLRAQYPAAQPAVSRQVPAAQAGETIDVNTMLQHAVEEKIKLSQEEVQAIFGPHAGTPGWTDPGPGLVFTGRLILLFAHPDTYIRFPQSLKEIKSTLSRCNDNKWRDKQRAGVFTDAASNCERVGVWLVNARGLQDTEAEIAFQRACGLPELRTDFVGASSPCAMLGDLYRDRGELDLALTVYLHAPNCDSTIFSSGLDTRALPEACLQGAADVYAQRGDTKDRQGVLASLCAEYGDKWSNDCELYKSNGGSVDLNAIDAQAAQYHQELNAQIEQANAAAVESQREHDAHMNAVIGAIQSLPDNSGPNAVVDAANQQAANMVAVGAANDAARRTAAEQRERAREQAAAAQQEANAQQAAAQQQAQRTAAAQAAASSASGSNNASSGGGQCTVMYSFVKASARVNPDGVVVGFLTNNSNQRIYVTYTFNRGGKPAKDQTGSETLNPGQTVGGEGSGIWASGSGPAAVDTNPPGIHYFAVLQSDEDQAKNCGSAW